MVLEKTLESPLDCKEPRPGSPVPSTPERREGLRACQVSMRVARGSASWLSSHPRTFHPKSPALDKIGLISLQSKGLSRVFYNTTVQKHHFFGTQLSSQSNSHTGVGCHFLFQCMKMESESEVA